MRGIVERADCFGDLGFWYMHDASRSIRVVAFYDRASTKAQATNGMRAVARDDAVATAGRLGWELRKDGGDPTFLDVVSGVETWPRPALARAILDPTVDAIAVIDFDRFSRGSEATLRLLCWCAAVRKNVICFSAPLAFFRL